MMSGNAQRRTKKVRKIDKVIGDEIDSFFDKLSAKYNVQSLTTAYELEDALKRNNKEDLEDE